MHHSIPGAHKNIGFMRLVGTFWELVSVEKKNAKKCKKNSKKVLTYTPLYHILDLSRKAKDKSV